MMLSILVQHITQSRSKLIASNLCTVMYASLRYSILRSVIKGLNQLLTGPCLLNWTGLQSLGVKQNGCLLLKPDKVSVGTLLRWVTALSEVRC